jgi:hypothetical protein
MARSEAVRSVSGYRRGAQHAEDYDLWLRIAEVSQIANLPDVLVSYRLHPHAISARHIVAQELAALAARGAARLRRSGRPDPLGASDIRLPLEYQSTQRMLADAMPRPEFALSFFRTLLGRETELGSINEWSRLYLRYGLRDLDGYGGAMMILLLGHNMVKRWRGGSQTRVLLPYLFWAMVTVLRHPLAACRIGLHARYWLGVARARLLQTPTAP